jgi:hypothetical protein
MQLQHLYPQRVSNDISTRHSYIISQGPIFRLQGKRLHSLNLEYQQFVFGALLTSWTSPTLLARMPGSRTISAVHVERAAWHGALMRRFLRA